MIKHILDNLPAAFVGAFLSGLLFYWAFWIGGVLEENKIIFTIEPKEHIECYQSTLTSSPWFGQPF